MILAIIKKNCAKITFHTLVSIRIYRILGCAGWDFMDLQDWKIKDDVEKTIGSCLKLKQKKSCKSLNLSLIHI